jgi:Icc-related predicted phosphoesterase
MRLALTSDLHGTLPEIPQCDVLVLAGDLCPDFWRRGHHYEPVANQARQAAWMDKELRAWLESVPAGEIVAIAGNHDFCCEPPHHIPELPWHYLYNSDVTIGSVNFYGTPEVPNLRNWAFYANAQRLADRAAEIGPCDVLISHGPPLGYGDKVGWANVGDDALEAALSRVQPHLVVCGHIHEGYGSYRHSSGAEIFNVAHNDEFYDPKNPVVTLDI